MFREGLSASDVALLQNNHGGYNNNGFGLGNGGGWLGGILIGALLGRGFLGGFNNFAGGGEVVVPNREISNDTVYTQLSSQMSSLGDNMSARFSDTNASINNVARDVLQSNFNTAVGQASLSKEIGNGNYANAVGQKGIEKEIAVSACNTQHSISDASLRGLMSDNEIRSAIDSCCCSTKGAINDVKFTLSQELCNLGYKIDMNTRDVIANNTTNTQLILGAINDLRIENKDQRIAELQNQINVLQTSGIATSAVDSAIQKAFQYHDRIRCCN